MAYLEISMILIDNGNFQINCERLEQILFPCCKFTTVLVNKEKKLLFIRIILKRPCHDLNGLWKRRVGKFRKSAE